jgi:hypothetical protein
MGTHKNNAYTVNARLAELTSRVTAAEAEAKSLRVHLAGKLEMLIGEAERRIQDELYATIRTLRESIKDGRDGVDGVDGQSIVGPRGEAGSVTVIPESEMAKAVIDARRKMKEHHAAVIARILETAEGNKKSSVVAQHFAHLLESIRKDIEQL